ncbi:MAG: hypothetical protein LBJ89_01210 [Holosporales bacterium]|jgi:chromosome segregation ATPase|nr:hypothetical protein [Holosporales bacterium]
MNFKKKLYTCTALSTLLFAASFASNYSSDVELDTHTSESFDPKDDLSTQSSDSEPGNGTARMTRRRNLSSDSVDGPKHSGPHSDRRDDPEYDGPHPDRRDDPEYDGLHPDRRPIRVDNFNDCCTLISGLHAKIEYHGESILQLKQRHKAILTEITEGSNKKADNVELEALSTHINLICAKIGGKVSELTSSVTALKRTFDDDISDCRTEVFRRVEAIREEMRAQVISATNKSIQKNKDNIDKELHNVKDQIRKLFKVLVPQPEGAPAPSVNEAQNRLELFIKQSDINKERISFLDTFVGNPATLNVHDIFLQLDPDVPDVPYNVTQLITYLAAKLAETIKSLKTCVNNAVAGTFSEHDTRISDNLVQIRGTAEKVATLNRVLDSVTPEDVARLQGIEDFITRSVFSKIEEPVTFSKLSIQFSTLIDAQVRSFSQDLQTQITYYSDKAALITQLSQELNELRTLINISDGNFTDVHTSLDTLISVVDALKKDFDSNKTEQSTNINNCNTNITTLEHRMDETKTKIAELETSLKAVGSSDPEQIKELSGNFSRLSGSFETLGAQFEKRISELSQRVTTELAEQTRGRGELSDRLNGDIRNLDTRTSVLEDKVSTLNNKGESVHDDIVLLRRTQDESSSNILGVTQRVKKVEDIVGEGEQGLSGQFAALSAQISELRNQFSQLEQNPPSSVNFEALENEINTTKAEITNAVSSAKAEISQEASALESRIDEKITGLASQTNERFAILDSLNFAGLVETINETMDDLNIRQTTMEGQVSKLEDDATALNTKVEEVDSEAKSAIDELHREFSSGIQDIKAHLGRDFDDQTPTVAMQFSELQSTVGGLVNISQDFEEIKANVEEIKESQNIIHTALFSTEGISLDNILDAKIELKTEMLTAEINTLASTLRNEITSAVEESKNSLSVTINERFQTYEAKFDAYDARLDDMATNAAVTSQLDELDANLKELINTNSSTLQGNITGVENSVTNLNTTLSSRIESDISELRSELTNKINEDKAELVSQITSPTAIEGLIADAGSELRALVEENNTTSTEKIELLVKNVGQLESNLNEHISTCNEHISTTQGAISSVNVSLGTMQTQIGALETQTAMIEQMQTELTSLKDKIGVLCNVIEDGDGTAGDNFLASVNQFFENQASQIQGINASIVSLTNELVAVRAIANSAQTTANAAQTTANTAQTTANAAQTTANSAQTTANTAYLTAEATHNQLQNFFAEYYNSRDTIDYPDSASRSS